MIILRAPSALRCPRGLQLGDNFVDCRRCARDRMRDGAAPERTKPFSAPREIHFWNRNVFTLDVAPDVNFGPIEQWLHPNVLALRRSGRELSPEFWRLIFIIPFELRVARRKISLFRASRILVAPNSGDQCVPFVFGERLLQRHGFQLVRHRHWIVRFVPNPARTRVGVDFNDKIKVVMLCCPFTKLQHLGKLIGRVDVQDRKGDLPKKRFAGEPDKNVGILPHRPRHGDVFEGLIRLAKNENALVLELVEMSTIQSHCLLASAESFYTIEGLMLQSALFDRSTLAGRRSAASLPIADLAQTQSVTLLFPYAGSPFHGL